MNFAIAACIMTALVCGSAMFIALQWLAWLEKIKGPKGQLEERLADLEGKVNRQALGSLVKRG